MKLYHGNRVRPKKYVYFTFGIRIIGNVDEFDRGRTEYASYQMNGIIMTS